MRTVNLHLKIKHETIGAKNDPVDSNIKQPSNEISRSVFLSGGFK